MPAEVSRLQRAFCLARPKLHSHQMRMQIFCSFIVTKFGHQQLLVRPQKRPAMTVAHTSTLTLATHVVVERSSEDGKWFAKLGENADGEKAVVFFQREGKQSALQSLRDGLNGVRNGEQAAKEYLQKFGVKQKAGTNFNQYIKNLEQKAAKSHSFTQKTPLKNEGEVELEVTEKNSFKTPLEFKKQNETMAQIKAGLEEAFTILDKKYCFSKDEIGSIHKNKNIVENIFINAFGPDVTAKNLKQAGDDLFKLAMFVENFSVCEQKDPSKQTNVQELAEIAQRFISAAKNFWQA